MDFLQMIGTTVVFTILCLALLVIPTLLLTWTAAVVYRRRSFRQTWFLLLLNIVVAIGAMILVFFSGVPTFARVADPSYRIALFFVLLFAAIGVYVRYIDQEVAANPHLYPVSRDSAQQ